MEKWRRNEKSDWGNNEKGFCKQRWRSNSRVTEEGAEKCFVDRWIPKLSLLRRGYSPGYFWGNPKCTQRTTAFFYWYAEKQQHSDYLPSFPSVMSQSSLNPCSYNRRSITGPIGHQNFPCSISLLTTRSDAISSPPPRTWTLQTNPSFLLLFTAMGPSYRSFLLSSLPLSSLLQLLI